MLFYTSSVVNTVLSHQKKGARVLSNSNNLVIKVFISTFVILGLVQSAVTKTKNEELAKIKSDISTLQEKLTQKESELEAINIQNKESDAKLENERSLMAEEIKNLKEKINSVTSYTETSLSSLSKDIIENKTEEAITLIKNKDFKNLSKIIHPVNGLTISSTPEIKVSSETAISKEHIATWNINDDKKYKWGVIDGEGKEIELTLKEYYDLYIYDNDYLDNAEIVYNKYQQRDESKKNNIYDVYKEGIVVEYFNKGTEENNFVDWSSIYLCFEKYNNSWYLSGIIHS